MDFDIPPGLTDMLQNFTVAVLRERPTDLVQFAADYFNNLNENRSSSKKAGPKKGVSFTGPDSDDEPMQTDSDEEPMIGEWPCSGNLLLTALTAPLSPVAPPPATRARARPHMSDPTSLVCYSPTCTGVSSASCIISDS